MAVPSNSVLTKLVKEKDLVVQRPLGPDGKRKRGRPSKAEVAKATREAKHELFGLDKKDLKQMVIDTGCYHPVEGMAIIARDAHHQGDVELALSCYKELAQYLEPKRRAIEHTVEDDTSQPLIIVMPESEIEDAEFDE